jgi:short-subunit dehydrogenase
MKSYKDKMILITGASSGIGKAFAIGLAERGAHLIITARSESKLNELAANLRNKYNIKVHVIVLDLSKHDGPRMLYENIKKQGLSIDVLINNAGFGKWTEFMDVSYETYQEMINLNINALVGLTHLFVPDLLQKTESGIINIASTGSFQAVPYIAVYCASKAFVLSFSEALYGEYSKTGLSVLALCPGNTASEFQSIANANVNGLRIDTAETVVENGLNALLKRKSYKIVGLDNYISALSTRILPRKLLIKIVGNMMGSRVKKK